MEYSTKIWLTLSGVTLMFPVNPKELEVKRASDADEFDIVGKGQIAIPQYPDLKTYKFKSFFPGDRSAPYVMDTNMDIQECCDFINNAMDEASICKFVIYRPSGVMENTKAIIRNFTTTDNGGEPDDLYFSIEIQEYRTYKPDKVVVKKKKKKKAKDKKTKAVKKKQRTTETKKIRVGASVVVNGKYWYTSQGAKPYGTAKNLKTEIKRIVNGAKYPYLIGTYGWTDKLTIQVK